MENQKLTIKIDITEIDKAQEKVNQLILTLEKAKKLIGSLENLEI